MAFPLPIAIAVFTVRTIWQRGRELVTLLRQRDEGPLRAFVDQPHGTKPPLPRVASTAVFLNRGRTQPYWPCTRTSSKLGPPRARPYPLGRDQARTPRPAAERLAIDDLGCKDGRIIHVTEFFSYIDHANVPGLLPLIRKAGIESRLDRDKVSYLLSRIELRPGNTPGMGRWRKRLFPATRRITADAAEYFRLSRERTVIMGSRIEL